MSKYDRHMDVFRNYRCLLNLIILNEREVRFSQPKRELFRLNKALEANEYLLTGCRKLVIETDAKYIHGMLNHPEMRPNATIN